MQRYISIRLSSLLMMVSCIISCLLALPLSQFAMHLNIIVQTLLLAVIILLGAWQLLHAPLPAIIRKNAIYTVCPPQILLEWKHLSTIKIKKKLFIEQLTIEPHNGPPIIILTISAQKLIDQLSFKIHDHLHDNQ